MQQSDDHGGRWSDDLRFAHVLADAADDVTMRFDIIAIDASGERLEIELLRNAF